MLLALLLTLLLLPARAFACAEPPESMRTPYTELIARTRTIVLADVASVERVGADRVRYHFKVTETVKGTAPPDPTLTFARPERPPVTPQAETDFDAHREPAFWDRHLTRERDDAACRMNPVFSQGNHYLLFLEEPYHWRSFERIVRSDDRWLATVRAVVADGAAGVRTLSVVDWLRDQRAIVVYRVDGCASSRGFSYHVVGTVRGIGPPPGNWQPVFVDFRPCRPGDAFMAIHYEDDRYVTVYPVAPDGMVDLTLAETEVELSGPRRVHVKELQKSVQ
jgi:hypothetical protein